MTADFTLFTTSDLQQLAYVNGRPDRARQCGSLRVRAAQLGIVGDWFGSTKEGRRYIALRQLETAGEIFALERQPGFDLIVRNPQGEAVKVGAFHADFRFVDADGRTVIEDTKSTATATEAYKLRKRIVEAQYAIVIMET